MGFDSLISFSESAMEMVLYFIDIVNDLKRSSLKNGMIVVKLTIKLHFVASYVAITAIQWHSSWG
jgi:hypothetical protein